MKSLPCTRATDTATWDVLTTRPSVTKLLPGDDNSAMPARIRLDRLDRSIKIWDAPSTDDSDMNHTGTRAKLNVLEETVTNQNLQLPPLHG